jgi:outer membrane protein insertion porin family
MAAAPCQINIIGIGSIYRIYSLPLYYLAKLLGGALGARAYLIFLLLPVLLFHSVPAARAEGPNVTAIEIKGLKRIEEGAVRRRISQEVGLPLSPEKITEDIKNIYQTGYFEDVRVEAEPFEGGLKLIYVVKEKPSIIKISFSGNKELDDSKLKEQLTISTASIADAVLINDNAIKLRQFYESEGFGLAEVIPVVKYVGESEVTLTYLIKEGPKVKIKEIKFEGNKALKKGELKKAMKTSERGFLSFITKKGFYKKSELEADLENIKDAYYNKGFIQVVVTGPILDFSKDRKWATVVFRISEGEQFKVSNVSISGNKVYSTEELMKKLEVRKGRPVSRKELRTDVINLTEKYAEKGYAVANVAPEVIPDTAKRTAEVIYHIDEGDIYSIGKIEIAGNVKTRDYVIRREVLLNEGDTFNSKLLKKSYQNINNLNFFDSVSLKPQPHPDKKQVDLDIDVAERATGFLSVGGGYSSVDKLIGTVDVSQGNLGGRGQYLKLRAELGGASSFYELTFREPWLFGKRLSLSTSIYKQNRDFVEYKREATGFELGLGKYLNEDWRTSATYRIEQATVSDILEGASSVVLEQEGTHLTSSITPAIVRDTRDNYLDPHTGSRNSLSVTLAGLGGDNRFLKASLDSAWYIPVGASTIALRGRYGYGTGIFGEPLPLYERYYVGGIYTIRGLGFGEAGPRDPLTGEPIGAKNEIIFNSDFIFPILPDLKLKGVVFFDAGQGFDTTPDNIRYTTGLGVRWISPLGPIRVEWGYNLNPEEDEKASRFEFAFGSFF